MRAKVTDFQVIDHGIEHAQYFLGCGIAFTRFSDVVTGTGDDFRSALDDCLEQISSEYDLGDTEPLILGNIERYGDAFVPDDAEDLHYHVSIRFNVGEHHEQEALQPIGPSIGKCTAGLWLWERRITHDRSTIGTILPMAT